jgi:secondary thiamine-phosphate synthase enzyme
MDNTEKSISFWQQLLTINKKPRGFHLITDEINQVLKKAPAMQMGLAHLFLQHTSASLAISENTCDNVAKDLETYFNRTVPEANALYSHTLEGSDDMPAHIKNAILGVSLTIPIQDNELLLGQWQGIFLCEHRNQAPARRVVITLQGCSKNPAP